MNLENLKKLAAELPDSHKANALALLARMEEVVEGVGDEPITWRPSLTKIVQATTDRSPYPKGTGVGDIVVGENVVEKPLKVYVLRQWTSRQYWDPDPAVTRMLCNSPDAKVGYIGNDCRNCPHSVWKEEEGGGSDCNKVITALAITADFKDIFLVNFAKTSYSAGMDLEKMLKKSMTATYKRGYSFSSTPHATKKNIEVWSVSACAGDERVTPDALLPFLKELFDLVGEDRKAHLEAFYKIVEDRRATAALGAPAEQKAIGNSSADAVEDAVVIPAETEEAAVSSASKKYTV